MKIRGSSIVVAVAIAAVVMSPGLARAKGSPERVLIISIPGVMWTDLERPGLPNLSALADSVAALSARTASRAPDLARGYLTMGAGNAAYVPKDHPEAHLAFERTDAFEGGTAAAAYGRRTGFEPRGAILHVEAAMLQTFQDDRLYGAEVGSLGESLSMAGVRRAVVSAADIAIRPELGEMRRAAVSALMDSSGAVDHGYLNGLLAPADDAPFGVVTDTDRFVRATKRALFQARVVLVDPGETSRSDEYSDLVRPGRVGGIRRQALLRTDAIVGRLRKLVTGRDMVLVLSPTGPSGNAFREHLAPMTAWGTRPNGGSFSESWLTSPTTRRQGMVVLSDVAPMVLSAVGAAKPDSMPGTPIGQGDGRKGSIGRLIELDRASDIRERFAASAFWVIAILLSLLAILAFIAFLGPRGRSHRWLVAVAYFGLAVFPAAHIIRAFEYWSLGVIGSHLVLYGVAAALAAAAWFLPGPRWAGGVALLVLAVLLFGSDVAIGGPLQVNGVFGHSPLVAGRFYGVSNPGYTILFAAALLGITGLVELRGEQKLPAWSIVALIAMLPLIGLPTMGADFGGLLAGVPAIGVTIALGRGWRIRWRTLVIFGVAALVVALGLSFIDLLRAPEMRTHLGRFADTLTRGDVSGLGTLIQRKGAAALNSLTVTRWTYFIPVGLAVLALLLVRPRGVLRDVLPGRPLLRAGLWGTLVAGVLGFAVNDSGISIPALALAFTVPFVVLVAVDFVEPRKS